MHFIPNCYTSLSRSLITTWGKLSKWEYFRNHKARHNFSYYERLQGSKAALHLIQMGLKKIWMSTLRDITCFCNEHHVHLLLPASFDCYLSLRKLLNNFKKEVWWYLIFSMYSEYFKRKTFKTSQRFRGIKITQYFLISFKERI